MADALDATLILWLNLLGTFVFGLSGGLAAVRGPPFGQDELRCLTADPG